MRKIDTRAKGELERVGSTVVHLEHKEERILLDIFQLP
jgi:hypothetical protein